MAAAMLVALLLAQETEEVLRSGLQKLEKGETAAALEIFDSILEANPKNAAARVGRARAWMNLKRPPAEILEEFARALRDDPRQGDAYLNRGYLLSTLNRVEEAVKDFDRSLEVAGGGSGITWALRGSCLSRLNRFEEAVRDLDLALGAGYRTPQTYLSRAMARHMTLDARGVIADASLLLEQDPAHLAALTMRWVAYSDIEAWENSLRDLRAYHKATRNLTEGVALWMYMVSRRAGKEDARETLHAQWASADKATPGKWPLAELFLDLRKEADLFAAYPRDPYVELFAAYARELKGDEEGALQLFERAARAMIPGRSEAADARAAVRKIKRGKNRARFEDLEDKLRRLKPFEARFEGEDVAFSGGPKVEAIDVRVDYAGRRAWFALTTQTEGKEERFFMYAEGQKLSYWGIAERQGTLDLSSFFAGFDELVEGMTRSLDKIAPPAEPGKQEKRPIGFRLDLSLAGASRKGEGVNLRLATGIGTQPGSWLSAAMKDDDLSVREEGDEVVLEMPATRKRIRIDRDTGFPRLFESRDAEGDGLHRLRRTSFKLLDAWPDPGVPVGLESMPVDPDQLNQQLETHELPLVLYLKEAMDRWDQIPAEGAGLVDASVLRWAARYADAVHAKLVRRAARTLIQDALRNGTTLAELQKDAAGNSLRFAARISADVERLNAHLQEALSNLADRVEAGVIGAGIDSEKHPILRKLVRAALKADRVGAARKAAYGDRLEKLYLEELATFRQL